MSFELEHLQYLVLITTLLLAIVLGFALQRTQFCSMGAISDIFVMQSWFRMRQWLLALGVMLLGTGILYWGGWIDIHQTIYNSPKVLWLSHLIGGILFGTGMSIASGCGARNLIRLGTGNIKSLVVLMVMGLFAQMTLRGIFGTIRVNSVDLAQLNLSTPQDLASMLHTWVAIDTPLLFLILASILATSLFIFAFKDKDFRRMQSWWISVLVGLSMVALGLCLGSFLSAWQQGKLRLMGFSSAKDTMHHLLGGALMGIGGITALGCTFGQGLSAMSTLALSSFITVLGFVIGVYLGLQYLERNST